MTTDPARIRATPESYLSIASKQYATQKYSKAEELFVKIIEMCKGHPADQKQPNILAEILDAIASDTLQSTLLRLKNTTARCTVKWHLDALDGLIATYEKQGRRDEALELAAKFVNLNPREPRGFLRLGQLLCLKHDPTTAYLAYKQGFELVRKRHPEHSGLATISEQRDKVKPFARFDPLLIFPAELVRMVFKLVDMDTLCRSLRVSKTWKTILTSTDCRDVWSSQPYSFFHTGNHLLSRPRIRKAFHTRAQYATGTLELSINGCDSFFQSVALEDVLSYSDALKVLQLRQPVHPYELNISRPLEPQLTPQLTHLYLGWGVQLGLDALRALLEASAGTLEEFSLFDPPPCTAPGGLWSLDWPRLEKLKVARLSWAAHGPAAHPGHPPHPLVKLDPFMALTPNLEKAWLDFVKYCPRNMARLWPVLRSLFLGQDAYMSLTGQDMIQYNGLQDPNLSPRLGRGLGPELGPFLNEDLRELHLEGRSLAQHICVPRLAKLEKLSMLFDHELGVNHFERIVRPSLESGTLRELDIRPLPKFFFANSICPVPFLPDWWRSESIEYMSVTGLARHGICASPYLSDVPELTQRFPNLRSVDIGEEEFSDGLLTRWMNGGVKIIYHRHGVRYDLQTRVADAHGAELINRAPRHIPSMQPDRNPNFNHRICSRHVVCQMIPPNQGYRRFGL
ncbi:hypothetical protein GGR52DRAFT_560296 [Hypoxylon sp. FL1284]|nr:hypothetical protein GGR52DRAFT_560296 [Hypoxylon sp. FL1284]